MSFFGFLPCSLILWLPSHLLPPCKFVCFWKIYLCWEDESDALQPEKGSPLHVSTFRAVPPCLPIHPFPNRDSLQCYQPGVGVSCSGSPVPARGWSGWEGVAHHSCSPSLPLCATALLGPPQMVPLRSPCPSSAQPCTWDLLCWVSLLHFNG